ncbi:MAG: anti-anti-sigma factor [Ectothiorhodospiraceae bacterium]|nr:anti-anti-sigma factor [Ectothiorhodospiraceae bacterium]
MKIQTKEQNGIVIISLEGAMLGSGEALPLNEALHSMLDSGLNRAVIDLSGVTFINSSGLGMLIKGMTTLRDAGGDLKISGANEKVLNVFQITKLDSVLDQYPNVDDALSALSA